jgi:putative DNA methylase
MTPARKKLIEVALPLEDINREAAREKNIHPGHPSTLHLWWARRPLVVARAVIFAQMVDDPGSLPEEFPTDEAQEVERQRLFQMIRDLVKWKNTTNERLLETARAEIRKSWARWCQLSGEDPAQLPPFHDPFAGGGSLPLEAQRLGLEAHASDLNPVAVLINKAMIEIPPRFAGQPPVNPKARGKLDLKGGWHGAAGLADDVRYYGAWMRQQALQRIGHLYPQATLPDGRKATVIAWLWARTVESPNPAFRGCQVPLVSSFWLSTKPGKEAWVEPVVEGKNYRFEVRTGKPPDKAAVDAGTKNARATFRCLLSASPITGSYIDEQANTVGLGSVLMAIVAEGERGRIYLSPDAVHDKVAHDSVKELNPEKVPSEPARGTFAGNAQGRIYGFKKFGDYFTPRQLVALTTFSDLVTEACKQLHAVALTTGLPDDPTPLRDGGSGAIAYAEAVGVYLGLVVSKLTAFHCTQSRWRSGESKTAPGFGRQALPMVWDFAEVNPWAGAGGDFDGVVDGAIKVISSFPETALGLAQQSDAATASHSRSRWIVSTDPPYYDNIGYADLSDFFYVWLRRSLQPIYPELFSTLLVPKAEELVASPYRHGSKDAAETFFLQGMTCAIHGMAEAAHPAFPVTIYYAFKQSERDHNGAASTGWETFLEAVIKAGFSLTGTWPMRTENATRLVGMTTNALASSIVLVCRPRPADAPVTSRRDFLTALKRDMPSALRHLQQGNIAPVDLAQASIGPGMAIFTRYARILESDGTPMRVRTALALINQTLDEVLAEQEGDFDADTGWAVAWFDQFGFNDGPLGDAETLCKAKNTAISGLQEAGIALARAGKVRLLRVDELPAAWDPLTDQRLTVWESVHHLIRALNEGETAAAALVAKLGGQAEAARELAYRLYNICERRKRAQEAQAYNGLVLSWPEIARLAQGTKTTAQASLF